MVVSIYLESFIHLYSYFLYKWAKGLTCTKQTADTANFIQEGAEEMFGVLKMFLLVNFSISNEKLCGTAHTRLLPRTLFSLRKSISLFSQWGILCFVSGICRKDVGKSLCSHEVCFDRSICALFSFVLYLDSSCMSAASTWLQVQRLSRSGCVPCACQGTAALERDVWKPCYIFSLSDDNLQSQ